MVDEQTHDNIVAQTERIGQIVPVLLELSRPPVETEEPVAVRSNPEVAGAILAYLYHIGTGFWSAEPVGGNALSLAVDTVKCLRCTDPQNSLTILVNSTHKRISTIWMWTVN